VNFYTVKVAVDPSFQQISVQKTKSETTHMKRHHIMPPKLIHIDFNHHESLIQKVYYDLLLPTFSISEIDSFDDFVSEISGTHPRVLLYCFVSVSSSSNTITAASISLWPISRIERSDHYVLILLFL